MNRRHAFTLIEMVVFGFLAIALVILIWSLLSGAYKGDEQTSGRLDGARTMAALLNGLRSDSWRAHTARADGESLLLFENQDDSNSSMRYRWTPGKQGLTRGPDAIGGVTPEGFVVKNADECTVIELTIVPSSPGEAKPIKFTIPVVVPGQRARDRWTEWAPLP